MWAKTYPRDDLPHNNLAVIYGGIGQLERALQEAQEAVHLDPNDSNNVANLGFSYLALNRFDEARRILEQALVHVPDNFVCRVGIYILALLRGDARTMQQQVAWASGKAGVENIFLSIEANTATAHGNLAKARDLVQRSVAADKRDNLSAHAAATQAQAALWEAQYGNVELARKEVSALLTKEAGEIAKIMAALALGEVKNVQRAEAIVRELNLRAPNDTILNSVWLPSIRAHVEISRGNPAGAVTLLQAALPYDLGGKPPLPFLYPVYVRGQAYLESHQAGAAAGEFQKILDHRGQTGGSPVEALAHLGLGRARAMAGDGSAARTAYQDFFAMWKDADPDIPILKQAKAEYAKLQ